MTKLKVGIITIVAAAVAVPLVIQHRTQTRLRAENASLQQQVAKVQQLSAENQGLSNRLVQLKPLPAPSNDSQREVMRLRGEVGRLRQEQASEAAAAAARKTNAPSPLSGLTSNPDMLKMIREQQKTGMTMIYKDFVKQANVGPEHAAKFNDLLADHIMENIDKITAVLREGKSGEEMNRVFAEQEAALATKVQALLGQEAFSQYQEYTRDLVSHITAEQFKSMLTGDSGAKEEQTRQLYQLMKEETQLALSNAGLDPDFQMVPSLNFRNIASEEEGEKNLKLLDSIYERVLARASTFLTPEDVKKFGEFRAKAINGNRMALAMNRKLMAPGGQ